MLPTEETLQVGNGRQLGLLRFGPPTGEPFFYFHGMPGSRYESLLIERQAIAHGLNIIAIDRPGYGLSDHYETRQLLDWPTDVTAVADALKLNRFGIIGVSGGGPYALACAYAIPDRLTRIGIVCGLGPVFDRTLLKAMPFFSRTAFSLQDKLPLIFRLLYAEPLHLLARAAPRLCVRMLGAHCGDPDRSVLLRDDVLQSIARSLPEAFRQGVAAGAHDMHLYQRPWGFRLADVTLRVQFWHGSADPVVPDGHSRFTASHLANAALTLIPGAGHFSLPVLYADDILSALNSGLADQCNGT